MSSDEALLLKRLRESPPLRMPRTVDPSARSENDDDLSISKLVQMTDFRPGSSESPSQHIHHETIARF